MPFAPDIFRLQEIRNLRSQNSNPRHGAFAHAIGRLGLVFLLFLANPSISAGEAPRNHAIPESLQSIPTRAGEQIDLAESLLQVSREWNPSLNLEPYRARLNQLTEKVRSGIAGKTSPEAVVAILKQIVHKDEGYGYTDKVDQDGVPLDPSEIFLHGLLDSRRGYCMNLSFLYLIVADRLDLPLHGVALPNHFFVRYESGPARINIETTESGASFPDAFYLDRFGIPQNPPPVFYMRNLGKKQSLGSYFSNVGMAFYRKSQPGKAVAYLELSAKINPESTEARNNLGNIYSEMKKYKAAIDQYLLALKANPNDMATLFNLGIAYSESGDKKKAVEAFLQAAQLDPDYIPAHRSLAQLYLDQKKYISALLHLQKLADLDPQNLQSQLNLASVYLLQGNFDLALEAVNRAKAMFPENPEVLAKLAEISYRKGNLDTAVNQYRYLIEYNPERLDAYIQLGWIYYKKSDVKMAISWTRRGLNKAKEPASFAALAWMNLGLYHLLDRNFAEAETWYQKALSSKNPNSLDGMIKDLEDASGRFPQVPEVDYFAGWLFYESGQKEKAEPFLGRYLQRGEDASLAGKARDLLARLHGGNGASPAPKFSAAPDAGQKPGAKIPGGMAKVPAGFFHMGSSGKSEDENPEHKVFLDDYFIDTYEVSAREYAEFLNAVGNVKGYYLDNKFGPLEYAGTFRPLPGLESFPVNNVSWYGADAYCQWKKKRLPTEAEWEKAARGIDRKVYPWGNGAPSPALARYRQAWTEEIQYKVMVPVDSMPEGKSEYGVFHMAGNVKEWVEDWYDREYYSEYEAQLNPRGPVGGEFKVIKGGSWRDLPGFIYSSFRNNSYPQTRLDDYGFRCAKSEKEISGPEKLIRLEDLGAENPGARFAWMRR